ncbi:MAG: tetratricopeptide repeat protein [Bacteroidota bacterium]
MTGASCRLPSPLMIPPMDSFYDRLRILRDFLADPQEDAYLFVCFSYVGLWREVIRLLRDELEVAGVNLTWVALDAKSDLPALAQLEKAAEKKSGAMVITGLAPRNPGDQMEMLTSLNFGREALYEIGGGKLFFVSDEAMQLVRRWAVDLFSQRARFTVYFPEKPERKWSEVYASTRSSGVSTKRGDPKNRDLGVIFHDDKGTSLRLALLEKQWLEARKLGIQNSGIYREIGIPMAVAYLQIGKIDQAESLLLMLAEYFDGMSEERELGQVLKHLGFLYESKESYKRAMRTYVRFSDSCQRWLREQPQLEYPKYELGKSFRWIGDIYRATGDLVKARSSYERELITIEALIKENGNSEKSLRSMATARERIGTIQQMKGKLEAAKRNYIQAIKIFEVLVTKNPNREGYMNDLAIAYEKLGEVHLEEGFSNEALLKFESSYELTLKIHRVSPRDISPLWGLVVVNARLYTAYYNLGRTEEALDAIQRAETHCQKLLHIADLPRHRDALTYIQTQKAQLPD